MTNRPGLLDVNVLIALIDPAHQFHDLAHTWFRRAHRGGWATCPITENGCLRIMSHPGYPFPGLTAQTVGTILAELTTVEGHLFWPDSVSMVRGTCIDLAQAKSKDLSDIYLVALAVVRKGKLVTFDRTVRWQSVPGCREQDVEVLAL